MHVIILESRRANFYGVILTNPMMFHISVFFMIQRLVNIHKVLI